MSETRIKEHLNIATLKEIFKSGEKQTDELKVGLEYERIPIKLNDGRNAEYYDNNGILNILNKIAHAENWNYITDNTNGNVLGLKKNFNTITLEPGCQIELSIEPQKQISQLENCIAEIDKMLEKYLQDSKIKLLNYGITPISTYHNINLLPKNRYKLMAKYLWGILSDVMMRETAGVQCCIDFTSEEDMAEKFTLANKLSPFMTAMYANSPIRGGVETGYKSFRALSWLYTDNDRCGFAQNFNEEFTYEKYIQKVLSTPIIFITRGRENIKFNNRITFGEYLYLGYQDYDATIEDFNLQANLYFPEVRLRNFIEIRNHDCVNKDLMFSIPAIYKGILYDKTAKNDLKTLLKDIPNSEYDEIRYSVPKNALLTTAGKYKVGDFTKEIIKIAETALVKNNTGEEKYLEAIKELNFANLCPADILLKNYKGNLKNLI